MVVVAAVRLLSSKHASLHLPQMRIAVLARVITRVPLVKLLQQISLKNPLILSSAPLPKQTLKSLVFTFKMLRGVVIAYLKRLRKRKVRIAAPITVFLSVCLKRHRLMRKK
ncbi:hypothetical protein DNK10_17790 [Pseudomonas daroniae]|nr:hypothetical protein DNK10_17790 [Pseudomonas daroniae]